jgi:hypothetical protein
MEISKRQRRLLHRALFFGAVIRLALWVIPFRVTRYSVERLQKSPNAFGRLDPQIVQEVIWAVQTASRRIPCASCLTQGLVTQILLGRLGEPSQLCLGVARTPGGRLEAHAWVEIGGRIVIGDAITGFDRYARLEKSTA